MKTHVSLLKTILFLTLVLVGCQGSSDKETPPVELPQELFRDGDIAFRRGTGITSRVVLAADREGAYSHTGILKKKAGQWYVIHAVPGEPDFKDDPDRVKMETVEVFFEKRKAVNGAIMRVSGVKQHIRAGKHQHLVLISREHQGVIAVIAQLINRNSFTIYLDATDFRFA